MVSRTASVQRITRETTIHLTLDLDGSGKYRINCSIPFMDHMLAALAMHGAFNLEIEASGDIAVDPHHLLEDLGLCLGQAICEALAGRGGIRRYGWAMVPMDESLIAIALDICGRPCLVMDLPLRSVRIHDFEGFCVQEFLRALVTQAGLTLHISLLSGEVPHHFIEATFKGLGIALAQATRQDDRVAGIRSTKGCL